MNYTDEQCATALSNFLNLGVSWEAQSEHMPGIQAAVRRYQAKLRKRNSRASAGQRIELPLPAGTAAALRRVCEAAGDEPVALLSQQIHMLDQLREGNPLLFKRLTAYNTDVSGVVEKYAHLVGGDSDAE